MSHLYVPRTGPRTRIPLSGVGCRLSGLMDRSTHASVLCVACRQPDNRQPTTDNTWLEKALTLALLLIASLLFKPTATAQDPQFSQFYAAPLYLNPALTGNTFQDRIILNYRKQWMGIAPGYETFAVSYDHNDTKLHSGFGGMVLRDVAGSNGLAFTHAAFNYSFEANVPLFGPRFIWESQKNPLMRTAPEAGRWGSRSRRSSQPLKKANSSPVLRKSLRLLSTSFLSK